MYAFPMPITKAMHHGVNPWHDRVNDNGRQAFVRQRSTDIKDRSRSHTAHILSLAGIVARAHVRLQAIYPPIIAAAYLFLRPASPDVGQGRIGLPVPKWREMATGR